jgi:large subunit ribosomal protein L25
MEKIVLNVQSRTVKGKSNNAIRNDGLIPAVLYGKGVDAASLTVNEREFLKAFKVAGESTIINLNLDGKTIPVLIQDVQNHYLKDHPVHIDFYAVRMDEKLKAHVPIHFIGDAPAVKTLGGILVKNLSEVEVECLPADLPSAIEVELSGLVDFEKAVRVMDLGISEKVKVLARTDEMVVAVAPPRTEEELKSLEEKPVEADVSKVEGVAKPEAESEESDKAAKSEKKE